MQKYLYLIIISFSLSSCYTYQVKKQVDPAADNKQDSKRNTALTGTTAPQMKNTAAESLHAPQAPAPVNIQEKLASGKNVKIDVEGRSYKVIVDRWENDSLVAHPVRDAKKTLKFHKNQINADKIAEKRFSQPIADILTVTAYAAIGLGIYLLVR